ncbi:O-methyltransferase [bacterium]|nr:O-methyltransferase [bacterium]
MSPPVKSFACNNLQLAQYAIDCFHPEDEILSEIRTRAVQEKLPNIHVGSMDGLHLEILIRAISAKRVIEIGSLAGYSGVCIARALPSDGELHTFELHEKNARVCADSFTHAGVGAKVTIHQGQALEKLADVEHLAPFDAMFIDADKSNYPNYLTWAEKLLRVGGTLIADNTFAWGLVLQATFDTDSQRRDAEGVRTFNHQVAHSSKWRATMLPTGEGLTVAVKVSD